MHPESSETLDDVLDAFESAWQRSPAPPLEAHLPAPGHPAREEAPVALACIDLERRLKAGLGARVEDYLGRFPELGSDPEAVAKLVLLEYEHRRRAVPGCDPDEVLRRFPGLASRLQAHLHTARSGEASGGAGVAEAGLDLRGYELLEAVGHGGMGEVFRARDPALGRDLAVKVLLPRLRGRPEVEARFLREARVTGSLQHPGIVPVHNLGRLPDGRLYFTMKLVRGQTLAQLLAQAPAERPGELLGVFEKVCQAVAYAHSKRVIHRDLKPANVMVGRFGEVQVLDWGLAKLLPAPEATEPAGSGGDSLLPLGPAGEGLEMSRAGWALGTPGFMPPEQACGRLSLVDERADVFSLGAILCVLLTGQPPQAGGDGEEMLLRAQRGDLREAQARLEHCGADGELVSLCRECLAVERADRPRDAGVVAARVAAYLVGVQQRLRQAELERAAAEARAREERKRRRVSLALVAAVVVVLLLGTTSLVYRQQQRQRAREQAEAGLAQAAALREAYRFADAGVMLKQVDAWVRQAADRELQQELE